MTSARTNGMNPVGSSGEDGLARLSRSPDNIRRIRSIQEKFVNGQTLLIEGRALVGEGILLKECRKKPKQRIFFLFNDILVYGQIVINGRTYSHQKIIPLKQVRISQGDDKESPFSWLISSPKKSFVVRANSDRERQEWLVHLERCIRFANGGNNPHSAVAAYWIPDDKADVCMSCNQTKFSAYNRRHHCRNCGIIVCDGCSKKRYILPHLDSKPVRVCDSCYMELSNPNGFASPTNRNDRTMDSSDSDADESSTNYPSLPALFYKGD